MRYSILKQRRKLTRENIKDSTTVDEECFQLMHRFKAFSMINSKDSHIIEKLLWRNYNMVLHFLNLKFKFSAMDL